jgi:hypothetical protein
MARYKVTGPDGKQYLINGPAGASKEQILGVLQEKLSTPIEEPKQTTTDVAPDATLGEDLKDLGISATQGILGLKEGVTGIADIPTFGMAGKGVAAAEKAIFGGTSQEAKEKLQQLKSAEAQQQEKEIAETKGFVPTAKAYLQRPGALAGVITESVPSMLGGAGIARGVIAGTAKKVAPLIAGAIGEGAITSGSIAESVRQKSEDGLLSPGQVGAATLAGVFTGGLGVFGGKVAQKLGIADIDTLLAGGASEAQKKGILKAAIEGVLSEGVLEELPQSLQEQAMQNLAEGRPWSEGISEAGASGMLAGMFMGGPASALAQIKTNKQIALDNFKPPVKTEEEEKKPATILTKEEPSGQESLASTILKRAKVNVEGATDEQLKSRKSRKGIPISGGPTDGAAGITETDDGAGLVSSGINTQSTQAGAGTQPSTLTPEQLATDINKSGLEFKNPAQLRKYITSKATKVGLAQLELDNKGLVKDLFDQYKEQLKEKPLAERVLNLENQQELDQQQLDNLHPYLKTISPYAKEAPLNKENGIKSAAIEDAFDTIDTANIKAVKQALVNLARDKTTQALADRKANIDKLMQEQRITRTKATEIVGPAEDYTYSSLRPTEFMSKDELNVLIKENEGTRKLNNDRAAEAKAREDFINTLTEDERASLEQQKYDAINRELESNRQQVINEQLLKKQETQKKQVAAEVEEQTQEVAAKPIADVMPLTETEGQILGKGERIVNKAVNSALSNNKPFLDVLKDIAGGEFNKYFSYQTVADMLQQKISVLSKPKGMGVKGTQLPTIKYGTVEKGKPGKFDPATNTITIDPNNAKNLDMGRVITHETLHYMLDHIIDNPKNLSEGQKNSLKRLKELHKQVKDKLGNQFDIPNLKEFVAEAFTNSEFQKALASLRPAPGSKLYRTAADIVWKISKAIVGALGLRLNTVKPVILEETIDMVSSIITDKAYTLPTATMIGKKVSYAPKQAGQPKAVVDPKQRKKDLTVHEYHKPSTTEVVKKTFVGEPARDKLITKFQNNRYAIKKWQKDLQKAGLISFAGDGFTNINDHITLAFGEANFRQKEYLDPHIQALQGALNDFAKSTNMSIGEALGTLHAYSEALHEPERRHIKFLKHVPLSTKKNIKVGNKVYSAADERAAILEAISSNEDLSDTDVTSMRNYLEWLVSNYKDAAGQGSYTGPNALIEQSADYNVAGGLNSQDVAAMLDEYNNDPYKEQVDNILNLLKPIQDASIELNKQGNYWGNGANNIKRFYNWEHYVPLKGRPNSKMPNNIDGLELQDKRLSNELKDGVMPMEGRTTDATNPIVQVMIDSALSAARAGRAGLTQSIKNAIDKKLLDGKVVAHYTSQEIYKGLDEKGEQLMKQRSNILHYNKDGSLDILHIADPHILESIRRTYQTGHPVLDLVNSFTSGLGQLHTRYNPSFPILNFVRDTLTNAFVMAVDINPMEAFKYLGAVSSTVVNGGLFKANKVARLYGKGDIASLRTMAKSDKYVQDMLEFIEHGGLVSVVEGLSVKAQLNRLYKELNKSKVAMLKEQIDPIFDAWTYTFELAARAGAYHVVKSNALANGKSMEEAIQMATVYAKQLANFEEVGEWGKGLGAMFMFFRPSATGAVRAFESIGPMLRSWESVKANLPDTITKNPEALAKYEENWRKQSRAATGVTMALMGAGVTIYMMSAGLSGDDDDDRNKMLNDDLSRWTRFARFDIGTGDNGEERVIQIPWGFGMGAFAAAGAQIAGATMSPSNSMASALGNLINIGLDSFLPLPISRINPTDNFPAFAMDSLTPSAVRPFLEYTMNKNSFGQEIYNNRKSRYGDAYTGGDNVPDMYKDASRMLFNATDGGIDWTPNTMYFFANNYIDGVTRLAQDGYGLGLTVTGQKSFDPKKDLVILDSFLSNKSNVDAREFAKTEQKVTEIEKILNTFKSSDPERYVDYMIDHPYDAAMVEVYNKLTSGDLKKLREQANVIRRFPDLTPKERADFLEENKRMQNMIKANIVDTVNMYKEMED